MAGAQHDGDHYVVLAQFRRNTERSGFQHRGMLVDNLFHFE